jgi:hypothetical protein
MQGARPLPQNFHSNGALPSNHIGVVVGWNKYGGMFFGKGLSITIGGVEPIPVQLNLHKVAAERFDRTDFDSRGGERHNNRGIHAELSCRHG